MPPKFDARLGIWVTQSKTYKQQELTDAQKVLASMQSRAIKSIGTDGNVSSGSASFGTNSIAESMTPNAISSEAMATAALEALRSTSAKLMTKAQQKVDLRKLIRARASSIFMGNVVMGAAMSADGDEIVLGAAHSPNAVASISPQSGLAAMSSVAAIVQPSVYIPQHRRAATHGSVAFVVSPISPGASVLASGLPDNRSLQSDSFASPFAPKQAGKPAFGFPNDFVCAKDAFASPFAPGVPAAGLPQSRENVENGSFEVPSRFATRLSMDTRASASALVFHGTDSSSGSQAGASASASLSVVLESDTEGAVPIRTTSVDATSSANVTSSITTLSQPNANTANISATATPLLVSSQTTNASTSSPNSAQIINIYNVINIYHAGVASPGTDVASPLPSTGVPIATTCDMAESAGTVACSVFPLANASKMTADMPPSSHAVNASAQSSATISNTAGLNRRGLRRVQSDTLGIMGSIEEGKEEMSPRPPELLSTSADISRTEARQRRQSHDDQQDELEDALHQRGTLLNMRRRSSLPGIVNFSS